MFFSPLVFWPPLGVFADWETGLMPPVVKSWSHRLNIGKPWWSERNPVKYGNERNHPHVAWVIVRMIETYWTNLSFRISSTGDTCMIYLRYPQWIPIKELWHPILWTIGRTVNQPSPAPCQCWRKPGALRCPFPIGWLMNRGLWNYPVDNKTTVDMVDDEWW